MILQVIPSWIEADRSHYPSKVFHMKPENTLLFPKEIPALENHHFLSVPCSTVGGEEVSWPQSWPWCPTFDVKMWVLWPFVSWYSVSWLKRLVFSWNMLFQVAFVNPMVSWNLWCFFFESQGFLSSKSLYFVRLFSAYSKNINPIHTCICI